MYPTCLFCHHDFPSNDTLERLTVGRRVAFDPVKGRLWVVCRRCRRWNLTPLEERWETIEECDRLFTTTRRRWSTDNVGIAGLPSGLELVRIGRPLRHEFAAWRYGRAFGLRRRNAIVGRIATGALAIGGAIATGGILAAGYLDIAIWTQVFHNARVVGRLTPRDGQQLVVKRGQLRRARLVGASNQSGWALQLPHTKGVATLAGEDARHALWQLMPGLNPAGGSQRVVERAVQQIESAGEPLFFLNRVAMAHGRHRVKRPLSQLPAQQRLAVEMAVNEETERRVLNGELALIEAAWREAEEIAAIADDLLVPEDTKAFLTRLRPDSH